MSQTEKAQVNPNLAYQWHACQWREVTTILGSSKEGLRVATVEERQARYGPNSFTEVPPPNILERFLGQLKSPIAIVLLLAALITSGLGEWVDASVITFALLIAVVIGVIQEGRASRSFQKLSSAQEREAIVWRDKKKQQIDATTLVPGDVVELQAGMHVPADLRLIETKNLSINEAALTGEWLPVTKGAEPVPAPTPFANRTPIASMGTYVTTGYGLGIVVATGDDTAVGELARDVQAVIEVETPLQQEIAQIGRVVLCIVATIIVIIFAVGLSQGHPIHDMLLVSIAVAVASIPEGLPAAVTIILAVGMESLLKRGGLVRNLLAAETLGSTTYILTDKTGTLTKASMAVTGLIHDGSKGSAGTAAWDGDKLARLMFEIGLCASDAFTDYSKAKAVVRGNPVEAAILEAAKGLDIKETGDSWRAKRIDYLAFMSEHRYAAGLLSEASSGTLLCVNGAPETLLEAATKIHTKTGVRVIEKADKERLTEAILFETRTGKRLVAVGYKPFSQRDISENTKDILTGLIFVGVLVFHDPVRKGVSTAIKGVQEAGAKVVLVTGDNPETALSIAREVGIAGESNKVLTGLDMEHMTDEAIGEALSEVVVFARVLPKQKMRLAQILQCQGEIVAMTGDGINDAPALRRANIGVAIGSGTEVAKEASDLVLINDTFATIHAAIEEGRRIIANLRKIIGYLLSTSLSEVVLIAAALFTGAPTPLLPVQILWANIIEEGLMGVAFAFEKGERGAMKRKPKDIHEEGIFSREMMRFTATVIFILSVLLLTLYFYYRQLGLPLEELRSIMFVAISMDSLFIAFAFRSLAVPLWRISLKENLFFIGSFLVSLSLLALVLSVPFFQSLMSYTSLPLTTLSVVVAFSAASLLTIEIAKQIFFVRGR